MGFHLPMENSGELPLVQEHQEIQDFVPWWQKSGLWGHKEHLTSKGMRKRGEIWNPWICSLWQNILERPKMGKSWLRLLHTACLEPSIPFPGVSPWIFVFVSYHPGWILDAGHIPLGIILDEALALPH